MKIEKPIFTQIFSQPIEKEELKRPESPKEDKPQGNPVLIQDWPPNVFFGD